MPTDQAPRLNKSFSSPPPLLPIFTAAGLCCVPRDQTPRLGAAHPAGCAQDADRPGQRRLREDHTRHGGVADQESLGRRQEVGQRKGRG